MKWQFTTCVLFVYSGTFCLTIWNHAIQKICNYRGNWGSGQITALHCIYWEEWGCIHCFLWLYPLIVRKNPPSYLAEGTGHWLSLAINHKPLHHRAWGGGFGWGMLWVGEVDMRVVSLARLCIHVWGFKACCPFQPQTTSQISTSHCTLV